MIEIKKGLIAGIIGLSIPFSALAQFGITTPQMLYGQPGGQSPEGQGAPQGGGLMRMEGSDNDRPGGQRPALKLPQGVSEDCKIALEVKFQNRNDEIDLLKLTNNTKLAELVKAKRVEIRALEDKRTLAVRALEDAGDAKISAATTAAEIKKYEKELNSGIAKLQNQFQKDVQKIEKNYKSQIDTVLKLPQTEKSELPSECAGDAAKLKTNPQVKGAFIMIK